MPRKPAPNKSQKATKTPKKTSAVVMRPTPNGGALQVGNPGNRGGGRPPDLVRQRLTGSFEQRIPVLEQIADGAPTDEFQCAFSSVLPHVKCPKCQTQMEANDPAALFMLSIPGLRSARPGDRTKALDVMAKYGLGTKDEVSVTDHPKFREAVSVIRSELEAEFGAERVDAAILRAQAKLSG